MNKLSNQSFSASVASGDLEGKKIRTDLTKKQIVFRIAFLLLITVAFGLLGFVVALIYGFLTSPPERMKVLMMLLADFLILSFSLYLVFQAYSSNYSLVWDFKYLQLCLSVIVAGFVFQILFRQYDLIRMKASKRVLLMCMGAGLFTTTFLFLSGKYVYSINSSMLVISLFLCVTVLSQILVRLLLVPVLVNAAKRLLDIVVATSMLIILSPLFLYVAFNVSKTGKPIIYSHQRIGRDGAPFNCLKFRSMVTNSDEVLAELLQNDPVAKAEWEKDFKLKNDPRITDIGKFIRKTSLDELPQLINVIRGEMSLVGPRPITTIELKRYKSSAKHYLSMKPGITGLWQISGRNDIDYDTRVGMDRWYAGQASIWTDLVILFKTVRVVLKREGSY